MYPLLIFILLSKASLAYGVIECSLSGYTVMTINGVFTDDAGAKKNKKALQDRLPSYYNSEPITVDYILNPSHLGGVGDLLTAAYQKFFDERAVNDFDLVDMLNSASDKVKTQKLLLVAHSQGNFYANSLYDTIADAVGGVPTESLGVYAVATPASRVAGNGLAYTQERGEVRIKKRY